MKITKKQFHKTFNILSIINSILGILAILGIVPFLYVWFAIPFAISHIIIGYHSKTGMFEYRSYINEEDIPKNFIKVNENKYVKQK